MAQNPPNYGWFTPQPEPNFSPYGPGGQPQPPYGAPPFGQAPQFGQAPPFAPQPGFGWQQPQPGPGPAYDPYGPFGVPPPLAPGGVNFGFLPGNDVPRPPPSCTENYMAPAQAGIPQISPRPARRESGKDSTKPVAVVYPTDSNQDRPRRRIPEADTPPVAESSDDARSDHRNTAKYKRGLEDMADLMTDVDLNADVLGTLKNRFDLK